MQRNGGAVSLADVSPLTLAKHPVESLSPPRIKQSASYLFALILHRPSISGNPLKKRRCCTSEVLRAKLSAFTALYLCPSQVLNPPSILHTLLPPKAMLLTDGLGPARPSSPQGTAGSGNLLPTLLLTLSPCPGFSPPVLTMRHRVAMWPNWCPQPPLQVVDVRAREQIGGFNWTL